MKVVLDTSVVMGLPPEPVGEHVAISAATLAELHFGVHLARAPDVLAERVRRLADVRARFDLLPVDEAVAHAYSRLAERMVAAGRQPRRRTMDLLIAATAVAHGAVLLTRNAADFAGLEDVVEVVAVD